MSNPFQHDARKSMTPIRRAKIFAKRDGVCGNPSRGEKNWGCTRKLTPVDYWQVEHDPALSLGGEDVDENCFVICEWCLNKKNADDADKVAESRNRYVNHFVPKEFRRSKSWGRR